MSARRIASRVAITWSVSMTSRAVTRLVAFSVTPAMLRAERVNASSWCTSISHGKFKRQGRYIGQRSDWKKAYVKLREGEKVPEFLEGA